MARSSPRPYPGERHVARVRRGQVTALTARRSAARGRRRPTTFYRYRRGAPPGMRVTLAFLLPILLLWLLARIAFHHDHVAVSPHAARSIAPRHAPPAAPVRHAPPAALAVAGAPTLSAARVDAILAAYGSPLKGHGADLVALSTRYQVDDAVALAFFVMESRAGTQGEALRTHSFGNLRPMPHQPQLDGYRAYRTWMDSAHEWFQVLRSLYLDRLRLRTVEAVVPVYAPSSDSNDPAVMIAGIHQLVACWRGDATACPDRPAAVRRLVATGSHG